MPETVIVEEGWFFSLFLTRLNNNTRKVVPVAKEPLCSSSVFSLCGAEVGLDVEFEVLGAYWVPAPARR